MNKDFKKKIKEQVASKKVKKSELIAVRLPMDVYSHVQDLCKDTGGKQSQIIIQALRDYFGVQKSS
ncbi:MAG: hypothetical protein K2Q26_07740 [Bdellovibrionales bacterium]|nr:hypothetical protein [Bdellovibrionales bacterium]